MTRKPTNAKSFVDDPYKLARLYREEDRKRLAWALQDYRERCRRRDPDIRIEPDEDGYGHLYIGEPEATPFDGSVAAGWSAASLDLERKALIEQWLAESERLDAA